MRIVVITSWPTDVIGGSGTAVFFNSFVDGLRARGHSLEIIAPNFDTSDYVTVTLQRFLFNTQLRTDPRVMRGDVVIGFDYDGYGLDPHHRPPFIASAHAVYGDVIQWEKEPFRTMVQAQAFFDQVSMQQADYVTIGSTYAKERIVALYGIEPEKIAVIPHGMSTPSWMPLAEAMPRVANDHPVILSVGKMYPRKRTGILLEAVALLLPKYPTLEVRIVGDGIAWNDSHATADALQLQDHVTWLGHLGDDAAFAREWRQADIFCHPSQQETFGFVYLEAMRFGLPVVAARAGAAPEVIGTAGRLAEPENPGSLAAEIDFFLRNEKARQTYSVRGRIRAAHYSVDKMIDGYEAVIERACEPPQYVIKSWPSIDLGGS